MKRIINISIITIAFTILSCEDYLDVEQQTGVTTGNYFNNPQEAQTALVGCYDILQHVWKAGIAMPVAATVMSDLTFGGTGASDADNYKMFDQHDASIAPTHINNFESNWIEYYRGIFRCNSLLLKLDQVDWDGNEKLRNQIEAEAKFLRAFFYFDLVRMFERVPLLTEPSDANIPQSDPDEVYAVIVEDLKFAIENASDTPYAGIAPADHGHAHKWAAEALLARVYLYYTGYYNQPDLLGEVIKADALGYLEDIITNGGFDLVDSYFDLWPAAATYAAAQRGDSIADNSYAGETNQEVIFAIKYTYTSNWDGNVDGNHWMVMNGLRSQTWAEYGYGSGWGACTVVPELYTNWDPDDDRRSASIMAIEEEGIDYEAVDDVKEYTGYFTKKYTPTANAAGESIAQDVYGGESFLISQFQDYFSIRYSDVLLMAAELGSASALDYVNEVRERAGVDPVGEVTKEIIFEERKLEFAFEGLRYWDLLRYDHTLDYAAQQITYTGTVLDGGVETAKEIDGSMIKVTRGLFPIPPAQVNLTDNVLVQNPGWE